MSKCFALKKFPLFPALLVFLIALSFTFSGASAGNKPDFAGKPEWKDNKDSVKKSDRSRRDEAQGRAEDRGNKKSGNEGDGRDKKDKKEKKVKNDKKGNTDKVDKMDKKEKKEKKGNK